MTELTENKLILAVIIIVALTIIELYALSQGVDGLILTTIIGVIAAIGGGLLGITINVLKKQ